MRLLESQSITRPWWWLIPQLGWRNRTQEVSGVESYLRMIYTYPKGKINLGYSTWTKFPSCNSREIFPTLVCLCFLRFLLLENFSMGSFWKLHSCCDCINQLYLAIWGQIYLVMRSKFCRRTQMSRKAQSGILMRRKLYCWILNERELELSL